MQNLQEAIDFIAKKYQFNHSVYPYLKDATNEQKLSFALTHNLLHMNKSVGKIAKCLEAHDHGDTLDQNLLKESVVKQFINTLRIAELIDLSADDLLKDIPNKMP